MGCSLAIQRMLDHQLLHAASRRSRPCRQATGTWPATASVVIPGNTSELLARRDMANSRSTVPKARISPALWATTSSVVTFLAIVVGLVSADRTPTLLPWGVAVLASLASGALGWFQARDADRERRQLLTEVATLRRLLIKPSIEIIEPSDGSGIQNSEMTIRGRLSVDDDSGVSAPSLVRERRLEVVPFVRPMTSSHEPSRRWWSQRVATINDASGEVSAVTHIGDERHGRGESFKVALAILPQGYIPQPGTILEELPAVTVALSSVRTVHRLA